MLFDAGREPADVFAAFGDLGAADRFFTDDDLVRGLAIWPEPVRAALADVFFLDLAMRDTDDFLGAVLFVAFRFCEDAFFLIVLDRLAVTIIVRLMQGSVLLNPYQQ